MKLGKSLLLGSAAGFIAVTGSQAADLPTRKAPPVEYVRICSVYGPGFFYIPGTDTCLKIGGKAELDIEWDEPRAHADPTYGTNVLGRVQLDARTATDWGLLRTFVQIDVRRRTGAWYGSGTSMRMGYGIGYGGGVNPNGGFPSYGGVNSYSATGGIQLESSLNMPSAFIQWGGLTAGRFQSFFDFYADNDNYHGMAGSDVTADGLAYTYTFGNGWSATLAIEDGSERRNVVASTGTVGQGNIFPSVFSGFAFNNYALLFPQVVNPIGASEIAFPGAFNAFYTGQRQDVPDVVGNVRVDQGWGSAQLSGLWHRVGLQGSAVNSTVLGAANSGAGTVSGGFGGKEQNGWAVQGGVKINVPYFAPGDDFWVQGAYAKGCSTCTNAGYPGQGSGGAFNYGASTLEGYDGVVTATGHMKLTDSWSVLADFLHYWTPTIRQAVFGSYWRESFGSTVRNQAALAFGASCPTCIGTVALSNGSLINGLTPFYMDGAQWQVGSNLTWSPVKNLDIGVEVIYVRNQDRHSHFDPNRGYPFIASDDSQWLSRLKISRAF
jgi:hypothetical protein